MNNEISKQKSIKEKADFIYLNSGLILSKLENDATKSETENFLQIFLLQNVKSEDEAIIKHNLLIKNQDIYYSNGYQSAIQIVFHLASLINESNFLEEGKLRLRNTLREYTKHFDYTQEDSIGNKKYIRLREKN